MRAAWLLVLVGCGRFGFDAERDGSSTDATFDSPPAACLLCSDFESVTLPEWTQIYGNAMRTTAMQRGGVAALQVAATGGDQAGGARSAILEGRTDQSLYMRAYFYVPAGPALTKVNFLGINGMPADGVVFLVDQDEIRLYVTPADLTLTTGRTMPRDRWACIEVSVAVDDVGAVAIALDNERIGFEVMIDTRPTTPYATLVVGMPYVFPGQAPLTVYVDDFMLATSPIGC